MPELSPFDEKEKRRDCLICGGSEHSAVFSEDGISTLRCHECGHVFSSFLANPHYDGYWGSEIGEEDLPYWGKARIRMHKDFLTRFICRRTGRLLDVGCGLGFFLKTLEEYPEWKAYGCEISETAVRFARERLGLRNVTHSRPDDVEFEAGSFDVVTMWDFIDHVLDPDPVIQHCCKLLKDDGICFIRTPNVSMQLLRARLRRLVQGSSLNHPYMMPRDHMHQYSESTIERLLRRNGFSNVSFTHLHPIGGAHGKVDDVFKNAAYWAVCGIALLTAGRLNFDNLFVVAQKA